MLHILTIIYIRDPFYLRDDPYFHPRDDPYDRYPPPPIDPYDRYPPPLRPHPRDYPPLRRDRSVTMAINSYSLTTMPTQ